MGLKQSTTIMSQVGLVLQIPGNEYEVASFLHTDHPGRCNLGRYLWRRRKAVSGCSEESLGPMGGTCVELRQLPSPWDAVVASRVQIEVALLAERVWGGVVVDGGEIG